MGWGWSRLTRKSKAVRYNHIPCTGWQCRGHAPRLAGCSHKGHPRAQYPWTPLHPLEPELLGSWKQKPNQNPCFPWGRKRTSFSWDWRQGSEFLRLTRWSHTLLVLYHPHPCHPSQECTGNAGEQWRKEVFLKITLGQSDMHTGGKKKESWSPPHTIYKNPYQMDCRDKGERQNNKAFRRKTKNLKLIFSILV